MKFSDLQYGSAPHRMFIDCGEKFYAGLALPEYEQVFLYTTMDFKKINEAVRTGSFQSDSVLAKRVDLLDSALMKSNPFGRSVRVFRGEQLAPEETFDVKYAVGSTVNYSTYVSSTLNPGMAAKFAGHEGFVVTFDITAGACLNDSTSEHGLREKEILLPRNLTFVVEKVENVNYLVRGVFKPIRTVFLKAV